MQGRMRAHSCVTLLCDSLHSCNGQHLLLQALEPVEVGELPSICLSLPLPALSQGGLTEPNWESFPKCRFTPEITGMIAGENRSMR